MISNHEFEVQQMSSSFGLEIPLKTQPKILNTKHVFTICFFHQRFMTPIFRQFSFDSEAYLVRVGQALPWKIQQFSTFPPTIRLR